MNSLIYRLSLILYVIACIRASLLARLADVVFSYVQIPIGDGLLVILLVDWIFPKLIVVLIVKFFVFFP